ncbi:hypothetical protein ACH4A8_19855 [Streptomyces vietnamensis]|uniref:hypothetical protein n=1 Tax=Streptomyces vietnamensis TaxID=362257 RepID=UPI0037A1C855
MKQVRRFVVPLAAALSLVSMPAASLASPVSADLVQLSCTETTTASYSPPLLNTPQTTTVASHSDIAPCAGLPGGYTSATTSALYSAVVGCTQLVQNLPGSKTYIWNDGTTSTFTYTRVSTRVLNGTTQIEFAGAITAGTFQGATAVETGTAANTQLMACSTTGVAELTFAGVLNITGL